MPTLARVRRGSRGGYVLHCGATARSRPTGRVESIAQLEEHLNARLLLRSTRALTLTEAGQRFYEHARLTIEEADRAEHSVRESSAGLTGRLRFGAAVIVVSHPCYCERFPSTKRM